MTRKTRDGAGAVGPAHPLDPSTAAGALADRAETTGQVGRPSRPRSRRRPPPPAAPTPTPPAAPPAPAPPAATQARARPKSVDHPGWPRVLEDLRLAVPFDCACRCHGVSPVAAREAYYDDPEVAAAVATAQAWGERGLLLGTTPGAPEDPRDRHWRLERLYPRRYHLPHRVTGVAPEDGGVPIATRTLTLTLTEAAVLARDSPLAAGSGAAGGGRLLTDGATPPGGTNTSGGTGPLEG